MLTGVSILLIAIWIAIPSAARACSCNLQDLDQVYHNSTDVFIAEVIAVRRVTERPVLSEHADYVATFRVVHVYKGEPEDEFELPFQSRYWERDPRTAVEDQELVVVAGCGETLALDEMRIFLLNGDEPFETHWCSSRVHAPYRVDMQFLEELAARYQ